MSTSHAEQSGPRIVTFTQQGDRALDRLAADLVDHCDGSTAGIADILEQVLSADIAVLADKLAESLVAGEAGQVPESPDHAARRRLNADRPAAGCAPPPPPRLGR
ncbi:hypothetical protein [Nocardioides daeguensis]|uniref:Uncharacterized protein n=1 Tax=Nocardioides daeguensis TaxID=908359 RepID=A0ABP6US89_9ACTN|nr:hypothetical protein [Nocardioides daeguensis]MBV6728153.1 hypothetical protein [Nocardioides daeguensis]MCR1772963.1 hypothetical protein [Nocardioides daeguensis]